MDHNTDQELFQPFTCTSLFTCPETPETQTTPAPIGSELGVLGAALKRVKAKRAQKQTAPAFPESDAQHEHALAQASASLAEREQALAKRERAFQVMHESLVEKTRIQKAHEMLLHQMQTVIEESNMKVIARDLERKENQQKLDDQKKLQDEMMEALKEWEYMSKQRSAEMDERERKLQIAQITCIEQETRVNAMEQALNTAREKMERRLEAVISECAGYEERAQACAELAHLRGVGRDALEAAEHALVRRAAESNVVAAQNEFMCPIGHDLMREPVMAADGHTYERRHIERLFAMKAGETLRSPMTNAELTKTDLYPNHALKSMIERAVDAKVAEINAR
jgi:hypothetical protein